MGLALGTSGVDFRSRMNLRSERVREQVRRKIVAYSLTLHQQLVLNTPIRTGQAKANWQVSLGAPGTGVVGINGLGSPLVRDLPSRVAFGAFTSGQEATIRQFQTGQVLYIFSNLPYIERLNAGYSSQAPAGFVEAAVLTARATYKTAA